MRAAVLVEPRRFELRDVPMPVAGPEDALIRVARTAICGTDLHIFSGHYAADRLPLIPGHKFCGAVAEAGRGADLVIESVGSAALYATAQTLIRKGGHIGFFGITGPDQVLPVNILRTALEENSLKGSVAGIGEDMHDALTLLSHPVSGPTPSRKPALHWSKSRPHLTPMPPDQAI